MSTDWDGIVLKALRLCILKKDSLESYSGLFAHPCFFSCLFLPSQVAPIRKRGTSLGGLFQLAARCTWKSGALADRRDNPLFAHPSFLLFGAQVPSPHGAGESDKFDSLVDGISGGGGRKIAEV